jgi:hypothetical protein
MIPTTEDLMHFIIAAFICEAQLITAFQSAQEKTHHIVASREACAIC